MLVIAVPIRPRRSQESPSPENPAQVNFADGHLAVADQRGQEVGDRAFRTPRLNRRKLLLGAEGIREAPDEQEC